MTPVFPARRAEEFDRLVESPSTGRADEARHDPRTSDLLERAPELLSRHAVAPPRYLQSPR